MIVAEWISELLKELLEARCEESGLSKGDQDELLNGVNSPLGHYAAREIACCAFGLITKDHREVIKAIRKIRNYFAHSHQVVSLKDREIAHWVHVIQQRIKYKNRRTAEIGMELIGGAWNAIAIEIQSQTIKIYKRRLRRLARISKAIQSMPSPPPANTPPDAPPGKGRPSRPRAQNERDSASR